VLNIEYKFLAKNSERVVFKLSHKKDIVRYASYYAQTPISFNSPRKKLKLQLALS